MKKAFKHVTRKLFTGTKSTVVVSILVILITIVSAQYACLVPLNWRSEEFWLFIIVAFGYSALICYWTNRFHRKFKVRTADDDEDECDYSLRLLARLRWYYEHNKATFTLCLITSVLFVSLLICELIGCPMFNANRYANLIQLSTGDFENDIINLESAENIVSVDLSTARQLGDRIMGSVNHSSWYEVNDEYNLIYFNDGLYRVSPLEFSDFFRFMKSKEIPGCILVNAKNQEAEYLSLERSIRYSPSSFFKYDLTRHLRCQFPTLILGKSFFELDDDGNPFWITAVKTPQIAVFGGAVENSFILTNASDGQSQLYTIGELTTNDELSWIDHVHSVTYLMQLIEWHYKYQNGFFNLSNTNKFNTSYSFRSSKTDDSDDSESSNDFTPFDGYNSSLSATGEILFSTGITPTNKSESVSGFVLISPRTGEAKFYDVQGAEESSAQASAEGLVSDLRYSASYPIISNISGIPSYFMELKDKAGIVRKYAISGIKEYSVVAVADTIPQVIADYTSKFGIEVSSTETPQDDSKIEFQLMDLDGTVMQVKEAQVDGYTHYYFTLNSSDLIFMSSIRNNNMQPFCLVEGAIVSIKYYVWDEPSVGIVKDITFGMNLW